MCEEHVFFVPFSKLDQKNMLCIISVILSDFPHPKSDL